MGHVSPQSTVGMKMVAGFSEVLGRYDAVSFDVYDTLVVRPYFVPTDLFLHLERLHDAEGFAPLRIDAEKSARRDLRREISLDEIYERLEPRFQFLKEKEVGMESELPIANPEVVGMMRVALESGCRVFVISDMYLPSSLIEGMLHRCGIDGYHAFYVSSEHAMTKHDGSLFRKVSEEQGIPLDRILHVGDNPRADQSIPRGLGMGVFPYRKPMKGYLDGNRNVKRQLVKVDVLHRSILMSMDMMIERGMLGTSEEDIWFRLGRRFGGPLIHFFTQYVADNADPSSRLLFASRDGYSIMKVYSEMRPEHVDIGYVHVQRLFSYVLTDSMIPYGRMELPNRHTNRFEHGKVVSRARYILGFFSDELGLDMIPEDPDEMVRIYNDNVELLDSLRLERAADYSRYILDSCGDSKNIELVDCTTMKYTSQRLIEGFLGRPIKGHYFITLAESPLNHDAYQVGRSFQLDWGVINIPEFFMCSPELPIRGWSSGVPIFDDGAPEWEKYRARVFEDISRGECEYSSLIRRVFGDCCPSMDYTAVVKWSAMASRGGDEYSKAIKSMKWASGPSHKDWFSIVPSDMRDVFFVIRRLVTDLVSRMNDK